MSSTLFLPPKSLRWAVAVTKLVPWLARKLASDDNAQGTLMVDGVKTAYRLKKVGTDAAVLYVGGGEKGLNNANWTSAKLNELYPARVYLRLVPATKDSYTTVVIDAAKSSAYAKLVLHPPVSVAVDYIVRAENVE